MRLLLSRLWNRLRQPWQGLIALCQLPRAVPQWTALLHEHTEVIREQNDLLREFLLAIGHGPQTPETPRATPDPLQGMRSVAPSSPPPNPRRLRTARDVTYSSRAFLREQDDRAEAQQAPWRTPEG